MCLLPSGWIQIKDPNGHIGPYAYRGYQWLSYDDIEMIRFKSEYIRNLGLGGAMIYSLDLDDFSNR